VAQAERRRTVPIDRRVLWFLLADFGALAVWAPNVEHSCILCGPEDPGTGAARRVQTGSDVVVEVLDTWEEGVRLGYRIEGLPPVAGNVRNDWELLDAPGGTEVVLTTTVDAGDRPLQRTVARLVVLRVARESDHLLDGLHRAAAGAVDQEGRTRG
jgi:hypothetical protein